MINLNDLAETSYEISQKRGMPYSDINPEKVLKYAAGELVEASFAAAYYKSTVSKSDAEKQAKRLFADELMDVIVCILIIAHSEQIDVEKSLAACIEKNKKRIQRVIK